ncbi:MAG: caspase family protein [Deltaproteobacteria bacterium]|nr:MAG: caspase family protein [Deltaproteobacteria bacterium]
MMIWLIMLCSLAWGSPWPELSFEPAGGSTESESAVVVGIDRYLMVDEVPGATRNAEDWYRYLTVSRGLPASHVRLLRDTEGTRERILGAVETAAGQAGPGGTVWVVFIGHGVPMPDGRDGALVGADAQGEPDALYPRSVQRGEILKRLEGSRGVLLLDACFSGRSARGSLMPGTQFLVPSWTGAQTQAVVLSAGAAHEFAGPLPGGGRPAYSYLALGGLLGWADGDGDGEVTAEELTRYTRDALQATVTGRTQTPERQGPDRVLSRGALVQGPNLSEVVIRSPPPLRGGLSHGSEPWQRLEALHQDRQGRLDADLASLSHAGLPDDATLEALERRRAALLDEAYRGYRALLPLLEAGGPDAVQAARAYVVRYRAAAIEQGDHRLPASVPWVDRVVAWIESGDLSSRSSTVTIPPPPRRTEIPWGLWRDSSSGLSQAIEADPGRAFEVYLAVFHLGDQIQTRCGASCEDIQRAANLLRTDALTYGSARSDRRLSGLDDRELGYVLLGIRAEGRDHWYAAAGNERPLLSVEGWEGFVDAVASRRNAWHLRAGLLQISDHLTRKGASGRCVERIEQQQDTLLRSFSRLALDPTEPGFPDSAGLADLLSRATRLARRAERCR